jgi:hypothetical protein
MEYHGIPSIEYYSILGAIFYITSSAVFLTEVFPVKKCSRMHHGKSGNHPTWS